MDKVLVTGGLGVIGSTVCRALLSTSRQPVIYDIGGDKAFIREIESDCVIEQGNIYDLPRLMGVISHHKPVAIAHLASLTGLRVEQFPWSAINVNLMGATTVFEAARLSGIQRVVFASSKQVYGPVGEKHRHPTYEPVAEDHPREPPALYGKLKRAIEDVAQHYAPLYGLDIIALRFGAAYGVGKSGQKNKKQSPVTGAIEAAIANLPFRVENGGEQCDHLCYAGDSAHGFIAALDSAARPATFRAYNIACDELISLRGMIATLKDLYPSWSAEAGPGLDYRRWGMGFYFRLATQKAKDELGFTSHFDFRRAAIDFADRQARMEKTTP